MVAKVRLVLAAAKGGAADYIIMQIIIISAKSAGILLLIVQLLVISIFKFYIVSNKKYILNAAVAEKKLRRMALEIAERNYDAPQLILIGIKDHGSVMAEKIKGYLKSSFKGEVLVLELGIDKNILLLLR